jgi:phenylalanyl-tRNA synthetase beta chain
MRVPVSWLAEYVDLPPDLDLDDLTHRLTMLGLKLERRESAGADVTGPLVIGRVLSFETEEHSNGKTIRWCRVDVGPEHNPDGDPGSGLDRSGGSGASGLSGGSGASGLGGDAALLAPSSGDDEGGRGIVCGAHNFGVDDLVVVALPGTVLPGGFAISARKTYGHVSDGMICSARELGLGDEHAGIMVLEPDAGKPGDDARGVLHLVDDVIEFEIPPDRGYALSIRGVARETALALGVDWRDPAATGLPPVEGEAHPVVIDDPAGCPVFVTCVVTGIDPSRPTPRWMARRLQLAGMRPLSLAIDITNYVMLELGQPNHGYDRNALRGPIRVRRAAPGEQLTTLDDVTRTLDPDDLLITDDSGPIGLAGVMGGATTELGPDTTDVVIEAAHFDPATISRAARRHRLSSEASKRFERGVDPLLPRYAAQRVAGLLAEYGGGTVLPDVTCVGEPPARPSLDIAASLSRDVVGLPITDEDAADALRDVGCEVVLAGDRLHVVPPTWRPDLNDPYDLVEEVARIAGYDRLPSVVPPAPPGRGLTHGQLLRRRIDRALAGIGLVEVSTYPFVGPATWDALGLPESDVRRRAIRIANPLSDEEPFLTTALLPGLLRAAARNVSRGLDDVALFEMASVFLPDAEPAAAPILDVSRRPTDAELETLLAAVPAQPLHLAAVLTGHRERAGWWGAGRHVDWTDAVGAVLEAGRVTGVRISREAATEVPWHPGRCARLSVDGVAIGHAGELHPRVCRAFDLPARTCAAEIDLDVLLAAAPDRMSAVPLSTYPVAKEDVALLVDRSALAGDVEAALRDGAGALCESVRLFDVYVGNQVPAGKKSLAFALRFRALDRTLTDPEIKQARDAAVASAGRRCGAELRS